MVSVADGIAALTASIGLAKELRNFDKAIGEAEFKLKVADLTVALADARTGLVSAQDEIAALKAALVMAEGRWEARAATVMHKAYRYDAPEGTPVGDPYCPRCEAVDHRLVRLSRVMQGRKFYCPQCKAVYEGVATFATK